jgi:DNA-binding LytR/AlgR family response regulator
VLSVGGQFDVCGITGSVGDTIKWLKENHLPDLALMDIQLSDGISFEIFQQMVVKFPVIFTTAYDNHAIEAFKNNAIDYLLKPIKENELTFALRKFEDHKRILDENQLYQLLKNFEIGEPKKYLERFRIHVGQQYKIIMIQDVAYFCIWNKMVCLVTYSGEKHMVDLNMDDLEKNLSPGDFFRINRQFIIHIKAIKKMLNYTKSRVKIVLHPPPEDPDDVITSSERSAQFKKWLEGS